MVEFRLASGVRVWKELFWIPTVKSYSELLFLRQGDIQLQVRMEIERGANRVAHDRMHDALIPFHSTEGDGGTIFRDLLLWKNSHMI